jgi:hypothetical protein
MKAHLVTAALLAVSTPGAFAQVFDIDHFKCYLPTTVTPLPSATVQLQDQFGTSTAVITNPYRLCNPTRKTHNGQVTAIRWPDDHLTLHQTAPQPAINRRVLIRNQFGDQTLTTHDARFLAVPTQKQPHGPPQSINHFNCYAAEGPALNVSVGLRDQFFDSTQTVLGPALFCNPVQKTHDGVVTPITDFNDHLTCYNLNYVPYPRDVRLRDQFGTFSIRTEYSDMLCVPTHKLAWQVID